MISKWRINAKSTKSENLSSVLISATFIFFPNFIISKSDTNTSKTTKIFLGDLWLNLGEKGIFVSDAKRRKRDFKCMGIFSITISRCYARTSKFGVDD